MADQVTTSLAQAKVLVMEGQKGADGKSPYIGANGNWFVWNGTAWVDTGIPASLDDAQIAAAVEEYLEEHPVEITVDDALSDTSENPVQNKVVNAALALKGTYSKPSGGIPATDLTQAIQTILSAAVLFNSQTLTEAQQAQARQNIGAASMSDLGTVFTLKGGVATVNDLPASGNSIGDVWYVESVSAGFIWITSTAYPNGYWEELGETIDLSAYIEKPSNPTVNYVLTWNGSAWVAAAIPSDLPSVSSSDNGKSLVVENGAWGKGYQAARIPRVAMASTDTTPALDPNKLYVFPEMASLTPTLNTPPDATIVNEYHFIFDSGATATVLTLPASVLQPDGFTVEANMHYEVSILEGAMTAQGWAVSA